MIPSNRTGQFHRRRHSDTLDDRVLIDSDVSDYIAMDGAHEILEAIESERRIESTPNGLPVTAFRLDNGSPRNLQRIRPRQFAFVDVTSKDSEALLDALESAGDPLEIIYLDPARDGILQIADSLKDQADLTSIHLISSGRGGFIHLGNRRVDRADLAIDHASALARIGSALAPGGDVLIYGCRLASSDSGQQMIDALARLTGAEVTAWDDLIEKNGNADEWELVVKRERHQIGPIGVIVSATNALVPPTPTHDVMINRLNDRAIRDAIESSVAFENSSCMLWEAGYSPYFNLHIPRGIRIIGESIYTGAMVPAALASEGLASAALTSETLESDTPESDTPESDTPDSDAPESDAPEFGADRICDSLLDWMVAGAVVDNQRTDNLCFVEYLGDSIRITSAGVAATF
ncbi:MAG: DUF4347 domain-containing protein [Planctomycetales bacterium]|nr:DUF4347 domain-containing protein [Planctomycetales bacterium]